MSGLRPSLKRMLVAAVAMSALALLWSKNSPAVVAALDRGPTDGPMRDGDASALAGVRPATKPLSEHLQTHSPESSSFDPFVGVHPPPPVAVLASAAPPFVGPLYVPPPPPPAINYRYMGQLVDPAGKQLIYLARPDKEVLITVGTGLDEGYVVESISSEGVRLLHPPTKNAVLIPLPQGEEVAALKSSSSLK
jgi:hypothetical protein